MVTTLPPQLVSPNSIAVDPVTAKLFIFDSSVIRQISMASQTMSTLAGASSSQLSPPFSNGVGTNAVFGFRADMVVSSNGHLYVADASFYRIRQIVISTQVVSTLAGDGLSERLDGVGSNSRFANLGRIAADSNGNLYVQDFTTVRKIVISSENVTTLAGHGVPNVDPNFPSSTFVSLYFGRDPGGGTLLYVLYSSGFLTIDVNSGLLNQTLLTSAISTISDYDGSAMDSSGNLFVAVRTSVTPQCHIRQYDMSLATTFLAGSATTDCSSIDGTAEDIRVLFAAFSAPFLTVDSANGVLYFYESSSYRIRALQASAPCSAGSYCPAGSSALNQGGSCPVGYYCRRGSDRIPCPGGTYCNAGTASVAQALPCSAGKYCPAGSSAIDQGGVCPVGYFCAAGADRVNCTAGKYCAAGSTIINQGGDCAAGYYCPSGQERVACVGSYCAAGESSAGRVACAPGYACPGGGIVQVQCSPGTYAPGGSVSTCTQCPRGLVAGNTGACATDSTRYLVPPHTFSLISKYPNRTDALQMLHSKTLMFFGLALLSCFTAQAVPSARRVPRAATRQLSAVHPARPAQPAVSA